MFALALNWASPYTSNFYWALIILNGGENINAKGLKKYFLVKIQLGLMKHRQCLLLGKILQRFWQAFEC
jgi:hypothetical protein